MVSKDLMDKIKMDMITKHKIERDNIPKVSFNKKFPNINYTDLKEYKFQYRDGCVRYTNSNSEDE
jgi:hypothetical protein